MIVWIYDEARGENVPRCEECGGNVGKLGCEDSVALSTICHGWNVLFMSKAEYDALRFKGTQTEMLG